MTSINGLEIIPMEEYRDRRGWNAQPLAASELAAGIIKGVHIVSMEPGTIRGNHVHAEQTEKVMIAGGDCLFAARDPETGERFERTFTEDALFLIVVAPGIEHAFKNVSDGKAYLFCAGDRAFDPHSPDTDRASVL